MNSRMSDLTPLDQAGFSIVEASLVALMVVLLASVAGFVANRQTDNQAKQIQPNVIHLNTSPSTPNAAPSTTTLELSDLGIEITVPNVINDLTYAAPDPTSGGYGVSTKELSTLDSNCQAISNNPPLGDFYRATGPYPDHGPGQLIKQFSAFYVAWSMPQTACSAISNVQELAAQQQADLESSFKTIVEIPPGQ
jgi:hypothetical protein